jgi:cation diffusion facilitator family transporter
MRAALLRSPNETLALGILAICVNIALMLVKIGVGVVGNSYALIADGIESASDIFSSLITWAGFQISLKPPDETHPFGHGRFETLAGVFSGGALLAAAVVIGYNAVIEIQTPHHTPAWFTLPVLVVVVLVKETLSRRVLTAGASLDSSALKGDAWHHRSDAISSGAVALGITDIHVRVDGSISVFDGHQIGHDVKECLLGANPRIRDVIVHIEPATMA